MAKVATVEQPAKVNSDSKLIKSFKAARRVSTPIVAIETPDPAATIASIRKALSDKTPVLCHDVSRGLRGLNELGKSAFSALGVMAEQTLHPADALVAMDRLPELSVVFMHNLHRQLSEIHVAQALWNLRDSFKADKRMVVGLGPYFQLPAEVAGDVIVLDEPLPTRDELGVTLDQQFKNARESFPGLPDPTPEVRTQVLDALVGLPMYTAEAVSAMALEKTGISVPLCWERKIKAIENTDGLSVWIPQAGDTTLAELRGIDNAVNYLKRLADIHAFNAIVFIDEADKSFAGGMSDYSGDSGVAKDQVGVVLRDIIDTKALGVMLAGVAGTGKTQLAKALAAYSGKPLIIFDLGAMKGGTVGVSERNIRTALKMVRATAEGRVLWILTANKTTIFTPEMNRRFPDQFFFDEPTDEGRAAIWPVYVTKNGLTAEQAKFPKGFDKGLTGAEIQRLCERAALYKSTVVAEAKYIVPQSISAKDTNDRMRRDAHGKFLSATHEGFYRIPEPSAKATRTISVEDES